MHSLNKSTAMMELVRKTHRVQDMTYIYPILQMQRTPVYAPWLVPPSNSNTPVPRMSLSTKKKSRPRGPKSPADGIKYPQIAISTPIRRVPGHQSRLYNEYKKPHVRFSKTHPPDATYSFFALPRAFFGTLNAQYKKSAATILNAIYAHRMPKLRHR